MQLQMLCVLLLALCSCGHTQLQFESAPLFKWAELVENVPTAVSHQSSTVVHHSVPRRTTLFAPLRSIALASPPSPAAAYVHAHAPTRVTWSYLYPHTMYTN